MVQSNRAPATIGMSATSRYRNTRVLIGDDNTIFFGTWKPPKIKERLQPIVYRVSPQEIKRPDLISYQVYRDPNMFWAIALRNNIIMPLKDIRVGQTLLCPHIDDILSALAKSAQNATGTT